MRTVATIVAGLGLLVVTPARAEAEKGSVREAAEKAVAALEAAYPRARALWDGDRPTPKVVTGLEIEVEGETPEERAGAFLQVQGALIGAPVVGVKHVETAKDAKGRTDVTFTQVHGDVPVLGRTLVVTMDMWGTVLTLTNETRPLGEVPAATIDVAAAKRAALKAAGLPEGALDLAAASEAIRVENEQPKRVWVVTVSKKDAASDLQVVVDAHSGAVVDKKDLAQK